MVVVGPARAADGGEMEARVCSVEWHRQWLHMQQYQQHSRSGARIAVAAAAKGKDVLPVVELKPFIRKVWRREKSLPVFYEQPDPKDPSGPDCPSPTRVETSPEVARYIHELREQRKQVDTRQSAADSMQRCRAKLHPAADFSFQARSVEHQQDLVPSFSTRFERTKTSLAAAHVEPSGRRSRSSDGSGSGSGTMAAEEMVTAGGAAREASNLMSAYIRDKSLQQNVCLRGGKLSVANLGRRSLLYLHPISAYRQKQPRSGGSNTEEKASSRDKDGERRASSMPLSRGSGFALPNGGVARRNDFVLSGSTFRQNANKPALRPLRYEGSSPHKFNSKLGAAHDSLLLLSQTGSPTALERNLSHNLELRLERCRRERSFTLPPDANLLSAAHYVAYDSQPTPGEMILLRAREANRSSGGGRPVHKWNDPRKPLPSPLTSPRYAPEQLGNFRQGHAEVGASPRSKSEQGDSGIQSSASGDPLDDVLLMGVHGHCMPDGPSRDLGGQVILEDPDEETHTDAWTSRDQVLYVSGIHVQSNQDLRDINKSLDEPRTMAGTPGVITSEVSSSGWCGIHSDGNKAASAMDITSNFPDQKTDSYKNSVFDKQTASEQTFSHAPEQGHFRSGPGCSLTSAEDSQSPILQEGERHTSLANSDAVESCESHTHMDDDKEGVSLSTLTAAQGPAETAVARGEEFAGIGDANDDIESMQTSSDPENFDIAPLTEESDDFTEIDKSTIFLTSSGGEALCHQSKSL